MSFRSSALLVVALVLCFASVTLAQTGGSAPNITISNSTIIYFDYTSGFKTVLPAASTSAIADATYSTNRPGSYQFGVDWNGDALDQFTIVIPSTLLQVTATGPNAAYCTPNQTILFTLTSPHICNYTANWTFPFSGILTVTYQDQTGSTGVRADSISTFFTNITAVGDPQFVGLRGQSYQVHGVDGAVYNIISEKNTQVNSRFVFLTKGECPIIDGVADTNCWSHPGSYMGEMSFQQVVDGELHAALISSGSAKKGFSMVQVDGKALAIGDKVEFGSFSVTQTSTHQVTVQTETFEFLLSNSDLFINQQLRSKVALSKLQSHGLLGQTHSTKVHATPLRYIEGEVDDYVIADSDIFGDDFVYNQFQA